MKKMFSIGIVSTHGMLERISLCCKDGKGSSSEVGQSPCSGKSNDYKRQRGKKTHSESSLAASKPSQYGYFCANKNWKVNSTSLPHAVIKTQSSCSWFQMLFLSCSALQQYPSGSPIPSPEFSLRASSAQFFLIVTLTARLSVFCLFSNILSKIL